MNPMAHSKANIQFHLLKWSFSDQRGDLTILLRIVAFE